MTYPVTIDSKKKERRERNKKMSTNALLPFVEGCLICDDPGYDCGCLLTQSEVDESCADLSNDTAQLLSQEANMCFDFGLCFLCGETHNVDTRQVHFEDKKDEDEKPSSPVQRRPATPYELLPLVYQL